MQRQEEGGGGGQAGKRKRIKRGSERGGYSLVISAALSRCPSYILAPLSRRGCRLKERKRKKKQKGKERERERDANDASRRRISHGQPREISSEFRVSRFEAFRPFLHRANRRV